MNELIILQQIQARLIRIECCLEYLCRKSSDSTVLLNQILNDVATENDNIDTANSGVDTANSGIDTANSGISTLSLDVADVGQGVVDANTAIANIDCGSCDLAEINNKLDEIISQIPSMKCKYKKDDEILSKTTKAKKI